MIKLLTIGVYGFTAETFFHTLAHAHTSLLCDLRFHRGMRGSLYSFANSARLQQSLVTLGIRYQHLKELAPTPALRELQKHADNMPGVTKRTRVTLTQGFIEGYKEQYLSTLNAYNFVERLGPGVSVVALLCVEREPGACHRSLVAAKLAHDLGLEVSHIVPATQAVE